jgi:uncharacterized protein (TIGR02145 family)
MQITKPHFILQIIFVFLLGKICAQSIQLQFTATGQASVIETIEIQNLTQNTRLSITGDDILHLVGTVGIENFNFPPSDIARVYPNPTLNSITLEFFSEGNQKVSVELFDISGKKITGFSEFATYGLHGYSIDNISAGIYYVRVGNGSQSQSVPILSFGSSSGKSLIRYFDLNFRQPATKMVNDTRNIVQMQYNDNDRLKFRAVAGSFITVKGCVPTADTTLAFHFVPATDPDGNNYATITLGTQIWMAENLKTSRYSDGTSIPLLTESSAWVNATTGAFCWYNNDPGTYGNFGALYNWYTVNPATNGNKNVCPNGWHVPSSEEWTYLLDFVGGLLQAGIRLKSSTGWIANGNGTDDYGFTALPSGYRLGKTYSNIESRATWWSTQEYNAISSYARYTTSNHIGIGNIRYQKINGVSVRCIRDEE